MIILVHFNVFSPDCMYVQGLKIDNCGDDRGLGFVARVAAINKVGAGGGVM